MVGAQTSQGSGHPYVPSELNFPGFVPGILSMSTILGVYGGSSLLVVSLIWILYGRVAKISKLDSAYVLEKDPHYLAEVWKEYSKGDSTYATRDAAVVAVEGLTAVLEGPASLLAAYAIARTRSYSHILQISISLGQLYGTAVYYISSYSEGDNFARNSFYYYAYYIFANSFWFGYPHLW